jgi:hypothetical protein
VRTTHILQQDVIVEYMGGNVPIFTQALDNKQDEF